MSPTNGHTQGMRILGVDPGLQVTGYAVLETAPPAPSSARPASFEPPRAGLLPTWQIACSFCTMV